MNALKIEKQENKLLVAQRFICTFSRSVIRKYIRLNKDFFAERIPQIQNTTINTMTPLEQRLVSLQHQLEQLHTEVSSLLAQTSITTQPVNSLTRSKSTDSTVDSQKSLVGIDRYRQLQAVE